MTFNIGERVELLPHLDLWMRGARFGEVVGRHKPKYTARNGAAILTPIVSVKLDHPQVKRPVKFFVTDLKPA
jgi:hypothetical protein